MRSLDYGSRQLVRTKSKEGLGEREKVLTHADKGQETVAVIIGPASQSLFGGAGKETKEGRAGRLVLRRVSRIGGASPLSGVVFGVCRPGSRPRPESPGHRPWAPGARVAGVGGPFLAGRACISRVRCARMEVSAVFSKSTPGACCDYPCAV